MDLYTKQFLKWAAFFTILVVVLNFALRMNGIQFAVFGVIAYFSAVVFPARLFAENEKRLPKIGELATLTLLWAVLYSFAVGTIVLGVNIGSGQSIALGAIVQLMITLIFALGFIGVISFLFNTMLYLGREARK